MSESCSLASFKQLVSETDRRLRYVSHPLTEIEVVFFSFESFCVLIGSRKGLPAFMSELLMSFLCVKLHPLLWSAAVLRCRLDWSLTWCSRSSFSALLKAAVVVLFPLACAWCFCAGVASGASGFWLFYRFWLRKLDRLHESTLLAALTPHAHIRLCTPP